MRPSTPKVFLSKPPSRPAKPEKNAPTRFRKPAPEARWPGGTTSNAVAKRLERYIPVQIPKQAAATMVPVSDRAEATAKTQGAAKQAAATTTQARAAWV